MGKEVPELKSQPDSLTRSCRTVALLPGQRFKFPAHAQALEMIASTKGDAFYRGDLAEKIEAHARKHGGAMRVADLAAHKSDWSSR